MARNAPFKSLAGPWQRLRAELTSACRIIRLYPTTLLWPLMVLALVLGFGVWGVVRVAQSEENSSKSRAASLALDTAIWFRQQLSIAIAPVMLMTAMVEYNPQYPSVSSLFAGLAPALLAQTPLHIIKQLEYVPNGVIRDIYPLTGNNGEAAGFNLFATEDREGALQIIGDRALTLVGPLPFFEGGQGVIVRTPIFITNVSANETFGVPDPVNPACGQACEYDPKTRTKFWGFAAAVVNLDALSYAADSKLKMLEHMGYRFEVAALGIASSSMRLVAASEKLPTNPVEEIISLPNNEWVVRVSPESGWRSKVFGGLLAAVVVAALALGVMMFAALVSRRRHELLLKALLPKEVIKDLHGTDAAFLGFRMLQAETTADLMLDMLGQLLEGYMPDLRDVVFIRQAILRGCDLYQPMDLGKHIRNANLDKDVASALLQQLGHTATSLLATTHDDDLMVLDEDESSPVIVRAANSFTTKGLSPPCPDCSTLAGALAAILTPQPPGWRDLLDAGPSKQTAGLGSGVVLGTGTGTGMATGLAASMGEIGGLPSDAVQRQSEMGTGPSVVSTPQLSHTSAFLRAASLGAAAGAATGGSGGGGLASQVWTSLAAQQLHQHHHHHAGNPLQTAPTVRLSRGGTTELREELHHRQLMLQHQQQLLMLLTASNQQHQQQQHHHHHHNQQQQLPQKMVSPGPPSASVRRGSITLSGEAFARLASVSGPPPHYDGCSGYDEALASQLTPAGGGEEGSDSDGRTSARSSGSAGTTTVLQDGSGAGMAAEASKVRRPPRRVASAMAVPSRAVTAIRRRSLFMMGPSSAQGQDGRRASGPVQRASSSGPPRPSAGGQGAGNGVTTPLTTAVALAAAAAAVAAGNASRGLPAGAVDMRLGPGGVGAQLASGVLDSLLTPLECAGAGPDQARVMLAMANYAHGKSTGLGQTRGSAAQRMLALPPPSAVLEEVERVLLLADSWQFDSWKLRDVTNGYPLSALGFYLIHRAGLIDHFSLKPDVLVRLLRQIEAGYNDNPYHNATHAADVLQTLHVIIHGAQMHVHYLDHLGLLAAYFAAIVHDYGHPGLTNDFLVATSDPLAVRYNDRSPLENHHSAASFSLMQRQGMDVLAPLSKTDRQSFRKQVIEMVLATDMKQHFSLLSQFNTLHRLSGFVHGAITERELREPGRSPPSARANGAGADLTEVVVDVGASAARQPQQQQAPKPLDETERLLSLQIAIKAADLGHLGEGMEVHKRWLSNLEEEFFRQGDKERQLGIPISPLFDRAKQGVSKSQVGFYDFVGLPLVHALSSAFPGAQPLMACFLANYNHWRAAEELTAGGGSPPVKAMGGGPAPANGQHEQRVKEHKEDA